MTTKFEIGKKYYIHDEWVSEFTVVRRTKCFVTFKDEKGEEYKSKIDKDVDGFGEDYERAYTKAALTDAKMFVGSDNHKDYSDRVAIGQKRYKEARQEEQERMDAFVNTLRAM
jgi:hypothetical protein